MKLVNYLKQTLDNYDPYGLMRVTTMQSMFMVCCIFFINLIYSIPNFSVGLALPLFGLMAVGAELGYGQRLRNMAVFCLVTICYTLLLSSIQNYRTLIVLSVGIMVLSLFTLSRKGFPYLALMIGPIQAVSYTSLIIPNGGNFYELLDKGLSLVIIAGLSIGLMALFPRIYFFRIWLRSVYFTIKEMEEKLLLFSKQQLNSEQLVFKHLLKMHNFTDALANKEHGFAARRISLKMINIYILLMALINNVVEIESVQLLEISQVCNDFCQAMKKNKPLMQINYSASNNRHVLLVRTDINYIIKTWNKLCLKM